MTIEEHDTEEMTVAVVPPVVVEDEEIGTTTRTVATTVSSLSATAPSAAASAMGTTTNHNTKASLHLVPNGGGKDLVWSGVTMKLLDRKTGQAKLNILKVSILL